MTPVVWTAAALADLEEVLAYAAERNPQGAATIAARVERAALDIATFPRAARRDPASGTYECIVTGVPLLLIYELITTPDAETQADIIAVFHTDREPATKPGRRGL